MELGPKREMVMRAEAMKKEQGFTCSLRPPCKLCVSLSGENCGPCLEPTSIRPWERRWREDLDPALQRKTDMLR